VVAASAAGGTGTRTRAVGESPAETRQVCCPPPIFCGSAIVGGGGSGGCDKVVVSPLSQRGGEVASPISSPPSHFATMSTLTTSRARETMEPQSAPQNLLAESAEKEQHGLKQSLGDAMSGPNDAVVDEYDDPVVRVCTVDRRTFNSFSALSNNISIWGAMGGSKGSASPSTPAVTLVVVVSSLDKDGDAF